ncbi:Fe-S cluster assembly protein SufD [Laceyella putida]|uniref:Fe-S cluster assembly protein SufD n=1 Tax=Laceyella putida TaxID=110101 RepID=A0ABW2RPP2_9BACL
MSVETHVLFDESVVKGISDKMQEPAWMLKVRQEAYQAALHLPLPKLERTSIDRWNFTHFAPFIEEKAIHSLAELPDDVRQFIFDEEKANVLVQKNGSVIFRQLSDELAKQGVFFADLAQATRENEALVKKYFMTDGIKRDEHRLAALHAALNSGGAFLYVPRNVEVEVPLQGLFWLAGKDTAMMPHIIVVAEANSRVDFVANFIAQPGDEAALNNSAIEVFVSDGARVRVATVSNLGKETVDVIYRRSLVSRDGQLEWIVADLSDGRVISDNTTHLNGEGGTVNVKTVVLGTDQMRANVTSTIHHWGRHTTSDINARSVMKDSATSILNSITKIEKGASKSDGQQSGKVLMLSPDARGDANPILLIDENDVTAGHAASVGRIDPIQLYYLMSRGISRREAEKLIIRGFLDAVVSEIPSESLQASIHRLIERKLQS